MIAVFDMYGTVLALDALQEHVRPYTAMAEAFCEQWRRRQLQLANAASTSGRYTDFDRITLMALHEIAPRFHVRLQPTDQKRLIDAWAELPAFEDVTPALDALHARGIPVTLLTNAVASTARNALAHAGLLDRFDRVLSADAVRSFKPSPSVYAQVLGDGVTPGDVLFFSSNDWDAMGARQAGFHSVWINRKRLAAGPKAERTIASLAEIELLLEERTAL
jgi:2-haloacid dehalogenase